MNLVTYCIVMSVLVIPKASCTMRLYVVLQFLLLLIILGAFLHLCKSSELYFFGFSISLLDSNPKVLWTRLSSAGILVDLL